MKIAFVGGGIMGEAMISGLINRYSAKADEITVSDIDPARCRLLTERYGVGCTSEAAEALVGKDAVVLAVKPQVLSKVAGSLRGSIKPDQMLISILAGVTIETLQNQLDHDCIVRVMPNTPAQIGEGISVWTATNLVTSAQKEMARTLLASLGKEIYVDDEKYLDMATALSGSGPAYVFLMIESMIDAGVHIGMSREMASELVLQTMLGSVRFAQESRKHPAELRNMVTSPGGTTAAGLLELEDGGMRAILTQAVMAAYQRAQVLGGKEQT